MKPALYNEAGDVEGEWKPVDLIGGHPTGKLVLRETGRFYAGVFLAERHQVAVVLETKGGAA